MPKTSYRTSRFAESLIREITRLANKCGAINLSQGSGFLHSSQRTVFLLRSKNQGGNPKPAHQKLGQNIESERRAMQRFGEDLDKETKGRWVRDALSRFVRDLGAAGPELPRADGWE